MTNVKKMLCEVNSNIKVSMSPRTYDTRSSLAVRTSLQGWPVLLKL
jgi:hypothetical protein